VRQTTNTKDTKEQVVAGVVDFTPLESDKTESGDKESLSRVVQARMAVSSPSDPFEVEAEKVAADFVKRSYNPGSGGGVGISRSITPLVARRASGDGLENSGAGLETSAEAAQKISRATASGGRPLDGATRSRFEDGLGADLSAVKVHTDSSSDTLCRSLSADAFSTGRDVFFSSGTFNPGTKSGDHLLAHELTHVVQQGAAPTIARSKAAPSAGQAEEGSVFRLTVGRANDPSEDLADAMADDAVASLRRSASRPGTVHRKAADPKDPLGGTQVDDGIERSINSQRGKGSSLGAREAEHFSNAYGTDLSGVKVHTDDTADKLSRSLQANAFTTGTDIFFRKGTYQPGTSAGDHLIGHELAHVATESGGAASRSIRRGWFGGAAKPPLPPEKHTPEDDTTVFQKIGMTLEEHLENNGDSVEFALEISIPISGYSVGAKLAVEAEKDDGDVEAKIAIAITGGVSIPGIDLKAALGGYLQAKGADGKMAGDLLGYALYRRMAESSVLPAEVQAYMFGGGNAATADANMSAIEMAAFADEDSDYFAESGASAEIEAEAGDIKVSGGMTLGTRTDRTSLDMSKTEVGGKKAKAGGGMMGMALGAWNKTTGGNRGAEKAIGRTSGGLEFKAELSSPIEAEVAYESKWLEEDGGVTELDSREVGIEVKVPEDAAEKIKPLVDTIFHLVNTKEAMAKGKTKKEKANLWVGSHVDKAKEMAKEKAQEAVLSIAPVGAAADYAKDVAKGIGEKLGIGYKDEESMAIGLTVDLKEGEVSVAIIQSEEKKITLPGVEASMKKSSKKSFG
jgi:hypothetical protein